MEAPFQLWVYLSAQPLLWLTLTVVIFVFGDWLAGRSGRNPLVNPVMIAIVVIAAILVATGTPYQTYFDGAQFVLQMHEMGARRLHPRADDREVLLRVAARHLPRDLMIRAYGWDPQDHGDAR